MYCVSTYDRHWRSKNARAVAEVAAKWKKQWCETLTSGSRPQLYVIGRDKDDLVTIEDVEITTVKETSKKLVKIKNSISLS